MCELTFTIGGTISFPGYKSMSRITNTNLSPSIPNPQYKKYLNGCLTLTLIIPSHPSRCESWNDYPFPVVFVVSFCFASNDAWKSKILAFCSKMVLWFCKILLPIDSLLQMSLLLSKFMSKNSGRENVLSESRLEKRTKISRVNVLFCMSCYWLKCKTG